MVGVRLFVGNSAATTAVELFSVRVGSGVRLGAWLGETGGTVTAGDGLAVGSAAIGIEVGVDC